ncbi:hypothetical protein IP88_06605 [alpha proteobacterium AAP81b]|nr:hypothetical protein IP88_06605 [alpha proteobacterium AAP81b]
MTGMTGGCACGAVRYRAEVDPARAYWCHCRMCQRALGAVGVAFVNVAKADLAWTQGAPVEWQSSPIARRGRCDTCGTPLTFHYPDSDRIDLTVASLDDPGAITPSSHFGIESRLVHWLAPDDLPALRSDEHAPLQARWAGARGGPE